jgi:hypothetical protein
VKQEEMEMNCFEVKIGLIAFFAAMTVGMVYNIAYGEEEWNTTKVVEDSKTGTLIKHKGEVYCFDETTTTKKEVLKAKDRNSIDETIYQNGVLGNLAEDDWALAQEICQNMVEEGQFPRDNQPEETVLEGTLTLEFDWDD